jgi:hypothetical protein
MASCLNDYHLLRLAWIFDINFGTTFRLLLKKDYASVILAKLPPSEAIIEITAIIREYMSQRADNIDRLSTKGCFFC